MLVKEQGRAMLEQSQTITCSALVDFDSSVLAVLMAWQRAAASQNKEITLLNPPEKLKVLARVYAIANLLGLE